MCCEFRKRAFPWNMQTESEYCVYWRLDAASEGGLQQGHRATAPLALEIQGPWLSILLYKKADNTIFNPHFGIIFAIYFFFQSQNQKVSYYGHLAVLLMEATKSWIYHLQTRDPREGALWFHPCLSSSDFAISYMPTKNWVRLELSITLGSITLFF